MSRVSKPVLVSICIPNFNNGRYLEQCLLSALAQTDSRIEVILSDDASTDDSLTVAEPYRDQIRLICNNRNLGQPQNTNRCIAASRGEFVVILHSDDALLPEFVERLLPLLQRHPQAGMAVGERMETDENGVPRSIAPFYDRDCLIPGEQQARVFMMTSFLPCQVLVRRTTLERAGGVHERHIVNLDGLLWFRCALQGDVAYVQTPVGLYRKHADSTTARYNRSIGHMMEYYATLSEMFRLAENRPYLKAHFPAAERRAGVLTLRYCHGVIAEKNYELAKRFLTLATVFDPELVESHEYRSLKYCVESRQVSPDVLYQQLFPPSTERTTSYAPPEGSLPLEVGPAQEVA